MSLWLGIFLFLQSPVAAQGNQVRRVLILDDFGTISTPGFAEVGQAIFLGLQESPYQIELYQEGLQVTLFPDKISQGRSRKEFIRKYSDRKPDVIITVGSASLKFIAELRERFVRPGHPNCLLRSSGGNSGACKLQQALYWCLG